MFLFISQTTFFLFSFRKRDSTGEHGEQVAPKREVVHAALTGNGRLCFALILIFLSV
jgi:hypothetical protein